MDKFGWVNDVQGQVFVGGLDSNVDEKYLRHIFTPYGEISYAKIPVGEHCGFVEFTSRSCAEEAFQMLNGSQIGGQKVQLSWGRSTQSKRLLSMMPTASIMGTIIMDTNSWVTNVIAMVHPMHKIQTCKITMDTLVMVTMSNSQHGSSSSHQYRSSSSLDQHHSDDQGEQPKLSWC